MRNNKWILPGIVIVLAILIAGLSFWPKDKNTKETIKVGAVLSLSGPLASFGTEYKRGLEMAIEEVNTQGGVKGKKIELLLEDDASGTSKAVNASRKLVDTDKVKYLFTAFTAQTQAIAPIAEKDNVLNIGLTVSKLGNGKTIFRDYWDLYEAGAAIGLAMKKEGVKRLGIISLNYSDTQTFLDGLKSTAGDIPMHRENFNFGDMDFKTQLTKIKAFGSDGMLVYGFAGQETINITKQVKELGLDNVRLFSDSVYGFNFVYQPLADTLVKMKVIDVWYSVAEKNNKADAFKQKYKAKYGTDLVGDAAYPYDDIHALAIALNMSKNIDDIAEVAENLRNINYNGVAGALTFDKSGNSKRKSYLQTFTANGWVKYQE